MVPHNLVCSGTMALHFEGDIKGVLNTRGKSEFSVLRIWPTFGSVFALKRVFVGFDVLCGLRFFFSNVVYGFRFLSTMMAVFRFTKENLKMAIKN